MLSRRGFSAATVGAIAALATAGVGGHARAAAKSYAPVLGDDGLYHQPWFLESFLEMSDDLAEASASGKRFAVIWEQKGCPYCKEMHRVNFARAEINDYVREHFTVVQLDLWGAREAVDFDGETLEERRLARKWRVHFTPTIQFFPETVAAATGRSGADAEVARMPGYFKPFHFLSMFQFVSEKAYERNDFRQYLKQKLAALKARGIDPETW